MISYPLKIVILEDNTADAEMIHYLLKKNEYNFESKILMTREAYVKALDEYKPDLILSDNDMPQFSAYEALEIMQQKDLRIPFILVTGTVSEEFAAGIIKAGADDYLLKDRLTRLPGAIEAALKKKSAEIEKQAAEQRIIQSEINLRAIFENTSEGFILIDKDGIVKAFNNKAGRYAFFSQKNKIQIGESIYDSIEESRKVFFKETISKVLSGKSFQYERSYKLEDGHISWLDFSITPVIEAGQVKGICITGRNITEMKAAQEQLERSFNEKKDLAERMSSILNTLPANIALLDENGIIVEVNDAWKNFADENGFIGTSYGVGDNYINISKNSIGKDEIDEVKEVVRGIRSVLKKKITEFIFEYPCHSPDQMRWFRMVATPLQEKNAGAVIMHLDISELRRLEQERLESRMAAQKEITLAILHAQEKERNAIGMELHDNVNQILVGTNLVLRLIKDRPEKINELITSCVDNILLAIGENRKIAHELVTPDLKTESLVLQITRLTQSMFGTSGLKKFIDHADFNEDLLSSDQKLAVYRVAQEQCTNIIKYADAKHVMFSLSTADDVFVMRITDDGKGMKAADKAKNGIGLQNMAGRISIFRGKLNIDTQPGKGFMLEIELPLISTRLTVR